MLKMPTPASSELAEQVISNLPRPGLFKRLLVVCYDLLLLLGVIMFAAIITVFIPASIESTPWVRGLKGIYFMTVIFYFYGWFWTHGGQTLGMRVWNLYLVDQNGKFIDWQRAGLRFGLAVISVAALGLGFTWILLNRQRRSWHDIGSGTHLVHIKPKSR